MGKRKNIEPLLQFLKRRDFLSSLVLIVVTLMEKFNFNFLDAPKFCGFLFVAVGMRIYYGMQEKNGIIKWLILPLGLLVGLQVLIWGLSFWRPSPLLTLVSELMILYLFSFLLPGLVDATIHFYKQKGWLKKHSPMLIAYLGIYTVLVPAILGHMCTTWTLIVR
ncbi:hypothetical protein HHL17_13180 [Chitinophaga sp. G-6-1-13]|uniref:Uncharacterized protein n=1 Tax=Chitinophaga fulva TaxID=2728842 RepID=A0A848GMG0_9BACT|nr:hypothetical protein [Chitinophaga fulva]NML38152.1 hypothetical protein [Chitinophaga fulva]